jgi:hypothetical protein
MLRSSAIFESCQKPSKATAEVAARCHSLEPSGLLRRPYSLKSRICCSSSAVARRMFSTDTGSKYWCASSRDRASRVASSDLVGDSIQVRQAARLKVASHRYVTGIYCGGCSPGDFNHWLICEPVSAWRALRRAASRTGPCGSNSASSRHYVHSIERAPALSAGWRGPKRCLTVMIKCTAIP